MKAGRAPLAPLIVAAVLCCQGGMGAAADSGCALVPAASPGGVSMVTGDCPRDARGVTAAIGRAPGILRQGAEVALGLVSFGPDGVFDRCAVMARLAGDPRWTASIDSGRAGARLRDVLQAGDLAPSVSDALARAGRRLRGVSLEKVLLADGRAGDCPASPTRVPIDALVWLLLD